LQIASCKLQIFHTNEILYRIVIFALGFFLCRVSMPTLTRAFLGQLRNFIQFNPNRWLYNRLVRKPCYKDSKKFKLEKASE